MVTVRPATTNVGATPATPAEADGGEVEVDTGALGETDAGERHGRALRV